MTSPWQGVPKIGRQPGVGDGSLQPVIDTADVTASAAQNGRRPVRLALAAIVLVGTVAGCGADAPTFGIGEGAADPSGYELAYAEGGGAEEMGTPASTVEKWGLGCRQRFAGGRSGTAVLLQQPCGENQQVFAVAGEFWEIYRSAGDLASVRYGFPVGRRGAWKQGWTQGFGLGGAFTTFFMQRQDERPVVLSVPMLEYYLSFDDRDTRFGYPTADLTRSGNRLCQQFEHSVILATGSGADLFFQVAGAGETVCSLP
jgi:hypothetical protein